MLGDPSTNTGLTLQDVGAAFEVGLAGSKWLTNHNKAEMLQHAAARVALRPDLLGGVDRHGQRRPAAHRRL